MKKYIYTVIAASCAMFASCSQDGEFLSQASQPQSNAQAITEISVSSGVESRATLDDTKTAINWEEGDALKAFGTNKAGDAVNADYTLSSGNGTKNGKFTNATSTLTSIQAYMYPAQQTATWDKDNSTLTINIPTVQTAKEGSFDKSAGIMYYVGDNLNVSLNSAVAFLKVTIDNTKATDQNVHAITISSKTSYLSGNIEVKQTSSSFSANVPSDASGSVKSVTLVASQTDPNAVLASGTYYIAVSPLGIVAPSISYTYINKGTDSHTFYSTSTTHYATVSTMNSNNNLILSMAQVQSIAVSSWSGCTTVYGVQLWENGPYFAEYNLGATNVYTEGEKQKWGITGTVTAENGLLPARYDNATQTWSSAWRVPTLAELEGLLADKAKWYAPAGSRAASHSYEECTGQSGKYGWKITGQSGYGALFMPNESTKSYDDISGNGSYWSSKEDNMLCFVYYKNDGGCNCDVSAGYKDEEIMVRPVLR